MPALAPRRGLANLPSYSGNSSNSRARSPSPQNETFDQRATSRRRTQEPDNDTEQAAQQLSLSGLNTSEAPTRLLTQQDYREHMGPGNEHAAVCWAIAVGVAVGVGITPDIVNQVPDGAAGDGNTMDPAQTAALLAHLGVVDVKREQIADFRETSVKLAYDLLDALIGPSATCARAVLLFRGSDGARSHHVALYYDDDHRMVLHDGATGRDPVPVTRRRRPSSINKVRK